MNEECSSKSNLPFKCEDSDDCEPIEPGCLDWKMYRCSKYTSCWEAYIAMYESEENLFGLFDISCEIQQIQKHFLEGVHQSCLRRNQHPRRDVKAFKLCIGKGMKMSGLF
jgi:hypothetical protein